MIDTASIAAAVREGKLLPSAAEAIAAFGRAPLPDWARASLEELVGSGAWSELNDRFYRQLEFGTGGMRGRTIGVAMTAAERGSAAAGETPAHAAVGTAMMNDLTLLRATVGLYRYVERYVHARNASVRPRLIVAYDVRHFSAHFCALAASAWTRLGGQAFIFDGPRPTPQLSYTVRWLGAHAGAVITASHNPPHDNGFKVYFEDGGQIVPPHDRGIVEEVNAAALEDLIPLLEVQLEGVKVLGRLADDAYLAIAAKSAIDPELVRRTRLRVAYSSLHGTGSVHVLPLLLHAGCDLCAVGSQLVFDPQFSTVKSPNPEYAEALKLVLELAAREGCDAVMATDPDCDRMGAAVRNRAGALELLSGNQIGALLADYRLTQAKARGWIPERGSDRACLIKTFVTSQLQDAIARAHGVKVVNTLTGFKWIAARLGLYEQKLRSAMGPDFDYEAIPFERRMRLQMEHGTFFVFGGEESYGYLGNDYLRDKDGNAACLMFAELCSWVKSRGLTVPEYLDEIFLRCGFYLEGVINIYYEGASGSAKIQRILESYRADPPRAFGPSAVTEFRDFGREDVIDADGEKIPRQDLYFVTLGAGASFAARGSGTEPKMKFYLFAHEEVADAARLPEVKKRVKETLESLGALIEADAKRRAEG
jgi:phosphoglucomutase